MAQLKQVQKNFQMQHLGEKRKEAAENLKKSIRKNENLTKKGTFVRNAVKARHFCSSSSSDPPKQPVPSKNSQNENEPKDKEKVTVDDEEAQKLADSAKMQQKMWDSFVPDGNMSITHPAVGVMFIAVIIIQVFYLSQFGKSVDEVKLKQDRLAERQKLREKEKVHLAVGTRPNEISKLDEGILDEGDKISATDMADLDRRAKDQRHHLHMAKESILQAKQLTRHVNKSMEQLESSMEHLGRSDRAAELRQANQRLIASVDEAKRSVEEWEATVAKESCKQPQVDPYDVRR